MPEISKPSNSMCKQCQHGKHTRVDFKTKKHSSTKLLELIHIYLGIPTRSKGLEGEYYFMLLIDDYSRMTWVYLLNRKSKAFDCFNAFKEQVENETILRIKYLKLDNGENSHQMNSTSIVKKMESRDSFD